MNYNSFILVKNPYKIYSFSLVKNTNIQVEYILRNNKTKV